MELFAQGEAEGVDDLISWAWTGPVAARVMGVESEVVAADPTLTDFFIQPNPAKSR